MTKREKIIQEWNVVARSTSTPEQLTYFVKKLFDYTLDLENKVESQREEIIILQGKVTEIEVWQEGHMETYNHIYDHSRDD